MARSEHRNPISMVAQCRTASQRVYLQVSDLSSGGCRVTVGRMFLAVGQHVTVRPEGFEGLPGVVKWCQGGFAGIMFDHPIYGPVVDHLCRKYPADENVFEVEIAA